MCRLEPILELDLLRSPRFSSYMGDLLQLNLFMPQFSLLKNGAINYLSALGYHED